MNAIDREPVAGLGYEPLLVAVAEALADLPTAGIAKALARLETAFGAPLRLTLAAQEWGAGGGAGPCGGTHRLTHAGVVLEGLPAPVGGAIEAVLVAFLRGVAAQHAVQAAQRAREGAAQDLLFEVTADGRDAGWRSPGARALFARYPALPAALAPAVASALAQPGADPVDTAQDLDGRMTHFAVSAHPAGQEGLWLIRVQDRSAIVRAQSKVDRRDQLLRRLFDLSPMGVVLVDFETGLILEANSAFMGFGAWSRETLIGAPIRSLLSSDDADVVDLVVADLHAVGRFGPYERRFVRPDQSCLPAILRGLVLSTGDGQDIVWLIVEDVSEQRAHLQEMQAVRDEALRAKTELHSAVQALPHGFVLFDAEDRIVMVNDQMAIVHPELAKGLLPGQRYVDALRRGVAKGIFPEAAGREEAFIEEILTARQSPVFERVTELPDDRVMYVLERATPTGGRVGLRIDVTPERDSERRLSLVIEGSQAGTWECDFQTGENRVNDRWVEMLGWTRAELEPITLERWYGLLHPEDLNEAHRNMAQVLSGQTDVADFAVRLRHRDGHWVWVQSRGRVSARAPDGTPIRMAGVHVDVSALKAAELRLEHIIEGAEVGTWHHDMRAGICHVNDLWVQMLGYTPEELCPITDAVWQSLLHPEDWDRLNRNMAARIGSGTWQFQDELRLRHKAGHWVWVSSRGRVSEWDALGTPVATSGVHMDISARKRLETDLEVERDFLSVLMETSVSGIMAVDEDARIVFFNREVQRIFELPGEALFNQVCDPVGLRLREMDGRALDFASLPCRLAQSSGQIVRDMRLRVGMADGREKVVAVNAATLPDQVMSARVVCTITDVTAAARAEDALRAAIDRAETANRSKSQFLANMSHELRTPLNGVLGMADLLAEGRLTMAQRSMIDAIRESGAHLLSIVNDLLDLAKIESGKLTLDLAPLRLTDLAKRIETMHGLLARRRGVALAVTFGPGADRPRRGDATRILQILHNLVGNAVKFTEAGSVAVEIHEDPATPDHLMIAVSDTGIGMSDDQTARVFEDFTQGDESITRRFGGTGLGLPIVRRLVGLMNGSIHLDSVKGQGTKVTVRLQIPACTQGKSAPRVAQDVPSFGGMRALLAEDNATNRLIIRAMLTRLGIEVTLASDGDEAVELWQEGRFDLVLLDISMPRKDGVSALQDLVRKAQGAGLPPVLAVTANAMGQDHQTYLQAGFAEVVTKPVSMAALAAAIAKGVAGFVPVPHSQAARP